MNPKSNHETSNRRLASCDAQRTGCISRCLVVGRNLRRQSCLLPLLVEFSTPFRRTGRALACGTEFFFSLSHLRLKVKWLRPAQASPSGLATPHFPSVSHERQEARQRGPVPFQADPYDSRVTGRKFGLPSMDPFLANDIGQHRASEEAGSLHRVPQELVIFSPFFRLFLPPLSPCLSGSCSSSGSHGPVLQIA